MRRVVISLVTIPALMLVLATVFLTLLAVGKTDGLVWIYALLMFALTLVNLLNERHDRA